MVTLERLSSSANRGTFYFLGRRNFIRFAELCVGSYPSPLEDSAPWPAKLSLLAIAGLFEFITIHLLADIISRQLRLLLRCCGNATTPLLTPALNSRRRHRL
jgi:hypothetical protein